MGTKCNKVGYGHEESPPGVTEDWGTAEFCGSLQMTGSMHFINMYDFKAGQQQ